MYWSGGQRVNLWVHANTCNSTPQTLIDQLTFASHAAYQSVPVCAAAQYSAVAARREVSQQDAALSSRTPLQNDTTC